MPRKLKRTARVAAAARSARASVCTTLLSIVPPCCGCGWHSTATPRDVAGRRIDRHIRARRPGRRRCAARCVGSRRGAAQRPTSGASSRRSTTLPLFRCESTISSMSLLVDVGVPDGLGVDHRHRAAGAAVQAARLVDAHAARPGQTRGLDARLAVVEAGLRVMLRAAGLAVVALVEAEEDVVLVVARTHARDCRRRLSRGRAAPACAQQPDDGRIGPQPADPLRQAVEADEAALLPGLQAGGEVRIGRRLRRPAPPAPSARPGPGRRPAAGWHQRPPMPARHQSPRARQRHRRSARPAHAAGRS